MPDFSTSTLSAAAVNFRREVEVAVSAVFMRQVHVILSRCYLPLPLQLPARRRISHIANIRGTYLLHPNFHTFIPKQNQVAQ
jgi:hypothetical protein